MDNLTNYYSEMKKLLEKRLTDLEYERDFITRAIESFNNIKYKFGDFILTKDGRKGYVTGAYTASYALYAMSYEMRSNFLENFKNTEMYRSSDTFTLESFLKSVDKDQVFYTCKIFVSVDNKETSLYNAVRTIVIKQEDMLEYTAEAKLLHG